MRKAIKFKRNDSKILMKGYKEDPENAYEAEYLDILELNDYNLLFAKVINPSTENSFATEIKIHEVAYDTSSNSLNVYVNRNKEKIIEKLEYLLNIPEMQYKLQSMSISELLKELNLEYRTSPIKEKIESAFQMKGSLIFPTDYDYQKEMDEFFGKQNHNNRIAKIPMSICTVTGVKEDLFKLCSSHRENKDESTYHRF